MKKKFVKVIFITLLLYPTQAISSLRNNVNENKRKYGKEITTKAFNEEERKFSGKKIYQFPMLGWQVESIFRDGRVFSETARPKGQKVKKLLITEREANTIADVLFPRDMRGAYKKQINNANFISHFFEHGVVSFEMELDKKRKKHVGIVGVRTVLYSNGDNFKSIKVNAYH
jgi:hypothetical protein